MRSVQVLDLWFLRYRLNLSVLRDFQCYAGSINKVHIFYSILLSGMGS
jgi:hypothetical protein